MSSKDLPVVPLFPEGIGVTDVFHIAWLLWGYWDPDSDTLPKDPSPQTHTCLLQVGD